MRRKCFLLESSPHLDLRKDSNFRAGCKAQRLPCKCTVCRFRERAAFAELHSCKVLCKVLSILGNAVGRQVALWIFYGTASQTKADERAPRYEQIVYGFIFLKYPEAFQCLWPAAHVKSCRVAVHALLDCSCCTRIVISDVPAPLGLATGDLGLHCDFRSDSRITPDLHKTSVHE